MTVVADSRGFRVFGAYAVAVLATYALASFAATQWALGSLAEAGQEVTAIERLAAAGQGFVRMLPNYGVIVAAVMAIALWAAATVSHRVPRVRGVGLVAAGFLAMIGVHLVTPQLFADSPAVTATPGGMLAQGLAGGIGGYLYYLMRRS